MCYVWGTCFIKKKTKKKQSAMLWVPTVLADLFLYSLEATANQEKRKEASPIL